MPVDFQCSCGQSVAIPEGSSAMEVACPSCNNSIAVPAADLFPESVRPVVPTPPPTPPPRTPTLAPSDAPARMLSYSARSTGDSIATPRAVEMVRQTVPWVRIMSVLAFISVACMFLGGVAIIVLAIAEPKMGPPLILGLIYIPFSLLNIMPAIFLWRYASHAKVFAMLRHENSLEAALEAQKSFWKYIALTVLILLGLYSLFIAIVLLITLWA